MALPPFALFVVSEKITADVRIHFSNSGPTKPNTALTPTRVFTAYQPRPHRRSHQRQLPARPRHRARALKSLLGDPTPNLRRSHRKRTARRGVPPTHLATSGDGFGSEPIYRRDARGLRRLPARLGMRQPGLGHGIFRRDGRAVSHAWDHPRCALIYRLL